MGSSAARGGAMETWEGIEREGEGRKKNGDIEEEEGAQPPFNKFLHPPLSADLTVVLFFLNSNTHK